MKLPPFRLYGQLLIRPYVKRIPSRVVLTSAPVNTTTLHHDISLAFGSILADEYEPQGKALHLEAV